MPDEAVPQRDGDSSAAESSATHSSPPESADPTVRLEKPAPGASEPVTEAAVPVVPAAPAGPPAAPAPVAPTVVSDEATVQLNVPAGSPPSGQVPAEPVPQTAAAPSEAPAPIWPTGVGGDSGPVAGPDSGAPVVPDAVAPARRFRSPAFFAIGALILVVIGSLIAAGVLYATRGRPTTASAGQCLKGDGIDPGSRKTSKVSLKVVDCGSTSAAYKVVGRVNQQKESAATAESKLCDPFPGTQFIYWEGVEGKRGTVLCLATNERK